MLCKHLPKGLLLKTLFNLALAVICPLLVICKVETLRYHVLEETLEIISYEGSFEETSSDTSLTLQESCSLYPQILERNFPFQTRI